MSKLLEGLNEENNMSDLLKNLNEQQLPVAMRLHCERRCWFWYCTLIFYMV